MVPTKYVNAADYLDKAIQAKERKKIIGNAVKTIRRFIAKLPKNQRPKAIACCGVSGLLVAPPIADRLGLDLIIVRKHDDRSTHSSNRVEGVAADSYIIVDDQVCTYKTLLHTITTIEEKLCEFSECVGVYLYYTNDVFPKARPMMNGKQVREKIGNSH